MATIPLGSKVRDIVTGFEGIATSRVESMTGSTQYCVSPPVHSDNKLPDSLYVDEAWLKIVDDGVRGEIEANSDLRAGGNTGRETPSH